MQITAAVVENLIDVNELAKKGDDNKEIKRNRDERTEEQIKG